MVVVVTGASGYIGGQTALHLREHGMAIIGIDTQPCPDNLRGSVDRFYQENFASPHGLDILDRVRPDAIIHCAGDSLVGPSALDPARYFENNFVNTKRMLDHVVRRKIGARVIFSSSAAVYGEPQRTPCHETDITRPISAYGDSKLMIETMMQRYHTAYGLDWVALRYFNACGADPWGRHGQRPGATHIIARVLESLQGSQTFVLNGDDYDTADGTCVRDYVHVEDIARAHRLALDATVVSGAYNLGTETGASNREIIDRCQEITGREVRVEIGARRTGDPAVLTASPAKFRAQTAWHTRYALSEMIRHAWSWYRA
jgi:UDP-glucose 4-epimerase